MSSGDESSDVLDGWALAALASRLNQGVDAGDVGREVIDALAPAFCDFVEVVTFRDDGELCRVASGPGPTTGRVGTPIPDLVDHPLRLAAVYGQVQHIDIDVPSQRHLFGPPEIPSSARALGITNAIVVPLRGRDDSLGALAVAHSASGRRFHAEDERFFTLAASLTGLALERVRATARHERAAALLGDAARIGTAMAGARSVDEVADILVSSAREQLGAARGLVYLVEPSQLVLAATSGYEPEQLDGWRVLAHDVKAPATDVIHVDDGVLALEDVRQIVAAYPFVADLEDFRDEAIVAVAMRAAGRHIGVALWAFDRSRRLDEAERRFVTLVADQAAAAIERVQLEQQRAHVVAELEASASDLALERARLSALAESGVIGIISGEADRVVTANGAFCRLLGLSEDSVADGSLRWTDLTPAEWADVDRRVVESMLRTGRAEPFEKEYLHADGRRVPVMVGGVTLSVDPFRWIVFVADLSARRDAERRAETARSQLETLLAGQRRIAETLRSSLVPAGLPAIPGYELHVSSATARAELDVGGDCYDVFPLTGGRWALMVADVCGKGAEAASVTAAVRHSLRTAALHVDDPTEVLRWVHDSISAYPSQTFCAVTYAVLDLDAGQSLRISVAGQEPALHIDAGGSIADLGAYGTVLGFFEPALHERIAVIEEGDLVAIYTDGITDAPGREAMSRVELAALLQQRRDAPLPDIGAAVNDALAARRPSGPRDDVVLLLLRRLATEA